MPAEPKDPADMTDAELIEAVATEVMGWQKKVESKNWWCWTSDGKNMVARGVPEVKGTDPAWNPLEDWNRTMDVVKAMERRGFGWNLNNTPWFEEGEDTIEPPTMNFFRPEGHEYDFGVEDDPQEAICLAALRAVRSAA